jgi:hypothetical protein
VLATFGRHRAALHGSNTRRALRQEIAVALTVPVILKMWFSRTGGRPQPSERRELAPRVTDAKCNSEQYATSH